MYGRRRRIGALIGFLIFTAFVLGIFQPIPTPEALDRDGFGAAVPVILLVLAIVVVSLSGAFASGRHMMRDPSARTRGAMLGTAFSAMVGVGFVALFLLAILR